MEEGNLLADGAQSISDIATSIPEGLRDVIGKRLSRLSDECNSVLRISAVIGREFRLDVLEKVAGVSEDELLSALEEAQGLGVIEERTGARVGTAFRFAHAYFRQTLYDETFAPRRIRLHQQVGRALEEVYAGRLEEHADELTEHFAQSTELEDLEKALKYGEMSAERAMSVYAYSEAVRLLEQALQVQEVLDPDDKAKRCDLLLALGKALIPAGQPMRVPDALAPEAFELADGMGDRVRAFAACRMAMDGFQMYSQGADSGGPEWQLWAERADELAEAGTSERVFTDWAMSQMLLRERRLGEAWKLRYRALELARQLGRPDDISQAAWGILGRGWAPKHQHLQSALASDLADIAPELLVTSQGSVSAVTGIWVHLLGQGERGRAQTVAGTLIEAAERTQDPGLLMGAAIVRWFEAYLDGQLEEAKAIADSIAAIGTAHGRELAGVTLGAYLSSPPALLLGQAQESLESWNSFSEGRDQLMLTPVRTWLLAEVGLEDEASAAIEWTVDQASTLLQEDEFPSGELVSLLRAALILDDRPIVKLAAGKLSTLVNVSVLNVGVCPARLLGDAAGLMGKPDEAKEHYRKALELSEGIRNRPEIALAHLELAELLLEHYPDERAEALEHLDTAITELRDMKMQPALERALSHRDILKA